MKIYIASSFDLIKRVEEVCQALESAGHKITVKWWERIYQTQGLGLVQTIELKKRYSNLSASEFYSKPETKASYESDRQGIIDADYLVFVADDTPRKYNGADIELGIAIGGNKPCFSIGELENSAMYHSVVKCKSIPELLEHIRKISQLPKKYIGVDVVMDDDWMLGGYCPICGVFPIPFGRFMEDEILELKCGHKFMMKKLVREVHLEEVK